MNRAASSPTPTFTQVMSVALAQGEKASRIGSRTYAFPAPQQGPAPKNDCNCRRYLGTGCNQAQKDDTDDWNTD